MIKLKTITNRHLCPIDFVEKIEGICISKENILNKLTLDSIVLREKDLSEDASLPQGEPGTNKFKILDGSSSTETTPKASTANKKLAKSVINTDQTIYAKNTNMREEPSKNSKILRTLQPGTIVHVIDTYIEGPKRMWCKVNYNGTTGWVSNNTINGTIK